MIFQNFGFNQKYAAAAGAANDPDAQAFIDATGISGTEATAINTLVLDLKAANIWTKFQAIYPLVGGTQTTCKYNLVNPADTDAAFRLTYSGTVTASSNGLQGNGTNGWCDTKYNVNTHATTNDFHMSCYQRSDGSESAYAMGAFEATSPDRDTMMAVSGYTSPPSFYVDVQSSANYLTATNNTAIPGFYILNRDANFTYGYKNTTEKIKATQTMTKPNRTIGLLASNRTTPCCFTTKQFAWFSIGKYLDATQTTDLYNAIQDFQTTLGRQV